MADQREEESAERVDRMVADLLAGRHLKANPSDAEDREAIRFAARLAGARDGYPRMSSPFRRRLGKLLEKGEQPPGLSRRSALSVGLGLAAGAVGGALAVKLEGPLAAHFAPVPRPAPQPTQAATPGSRGTVEPRTELGRWTNTGLMVHDLVDGVPQRVRAGAITAFLVRHGHQVVGLSAICTHLPCELVWQGDRKVLNCPCHNLGFDVNGESLHESYPLPALPFVKVRVVDGRVEVLGT